MRPLPRSQPLRSQLARRARACSHPRTPQASPALLLQAHGATPISFPALCRALRRVQYQVVALHLSQAGTSGRTIRPLPTVRHSLSLNPNGFLHLRAISNKCSLNLPWQHPVQGSSVQPCLTSRTPISAQSRKSLSHTTLDRWTICLTEDRMDVLCSTQCTRRGGWKRITLGIPRR